MSSFRVLHLGLGRFHRAHQAWYFDRYNETHPESAWLMSSWSMRSATESEKLAENGMRYTHLTVGSERPISRTITAIQETGWASGDRELLLKRFLDPGLEWITLTVTEKGYHLDSNARLNLTDTQVRRDLENSEKPETTIGVLAWGLRHRLAASPKPIAIVSCDNLSSNGRKLREALLDYYRASSDPTAQLVDRYVDFPNTMIDRIVPASADPAVVSTEPFSEWIIENRFRGARPALDGVVFTDEVAPFEARKLKLLNAAHSFLAYAGLLKGHRFVHEAIRDAELRKKVEELHAEVIPLLRGFSKDEYLDYSARLIERFRNQHLPHELRQIAMDGSKKLPERIFPSLREASRRGTAHSVLSEAVQSWLRFLWLATREGQWKIEDPIVGKVQELRELDLSAFSSEILTHLGERG